MILEMLGLQLADVMAGTFGGLCNVFIFKRQGIAQIAGAIVVGAVVGGYAGPLTKLLPLGQFTNLVAGFIGGALLKAAADTLLKKFPGTFNGAANNGDGNEPPRTP